MIKFERGERKGRGLEVNSSIQIISICCPPNWSVKVYSPSLIHLFYLSSLFSPPSFVEHSVKVSSSRTHLVLFKKLKNQFNTIKSLKTNLIFFFNVKGSNDEFSLQ
jgi:hypothetical protein